MIVAGQDIVVFIYDGSQWKPYVCATSCELNVNTDFIETSVSGDGLFASFLPTKNSFTGTLNGLVDLFSDGSTLRLPDLRMKQLAHEIFLLRFTRTNLDAEYYTDEAMFFITNTTDTGSFDGVNSFSMAIQGTGALTQLDVPPPSYPPDCIGALRYEFDGVQDQDTFIFDGSGGTDDLRDKDILIADKDGVDFRVIFSGTPAGKEVRYTASTGEFVWSIPFEEAEQGFIIYQ